MKVAKRASRTRKLLIAEISEVVFGFSSGVPQPPQYPSTRLFSFPQYAQVKVGFSASGTLDVKSGREN
jgi:hypothetical protein